MSRPCFTLCAAALALLPATSAPAAQGGPDAYGNTFIDSDEPGGPAFNWIELQGLGTALSLSDDSSTTVSIGFDFPFYGALHGSVEINSNGTLAFTDYITLSNTSLPYSGTSAPFIAVFWDDLNPGSGGTVYHHLQGTAPNRQFIVEWKDVPHYGGSEDYELQAVLYEGTGAVVLQYNDVEEGSGSYDQGASATVGIQGDTSTALQYSYNSTALHNGLAILFSACQGVDGDGDGFTDCDLDCDDSDATVYPGAPEICDGQDNDCDGHGDDADGDGDGYTACDGDCDDTEPDAYPGNPEVCDSIDNDCNGIVDDGVGDDDDGDGVTVCQGDCDDSDPNTYPGAPDPCDGIDSDCGNDLYLENDDDNDGYSECEGDCDDGTSAVHPGHPEECDGIDNDCDPATDENEDEDGDGYSACQGDCDDQDPGTNPGATEVCGGGDEDCDGTVDEGFDQDGDGYSTCGDGPAGGDCDDSDPSIHPGADDPPGDGIDQDCDGADGPGGDDDTGDDDDAGDDDSAGDDAASASPDGYTFGCQCRQGTAAPAAAGARSRCWPSPCCSGGADPVPFRSARVRGATGQRIGAPTRTVGFHRLP